MQQWVQTVSSLITANPEAKIPDGQLSGCATFLVDGEEVRITVVTGNPPQVPSVVGFSKQSVNPSPETGLGGVKYAFILRPGGGWGALIQTLRVIKIDGNIAIFERVGKEEWFLPNSSPRS